ncbi:hypothetical protein TRM7615_04785 [Falsiruegeria mediterranea M17]|jgi:Polysaccharide lyase|uniref:Alginate lyase 2 domain-containing protein n=2 Tax=Falsiruegeria TaxID=2854184 RepID=A0A2R8CFL4_9RHOB|nr:hypothetical protein TRM7615_04785 [Falsiruegeria mediterranea M17]
MFGKLRCSNGRCAKLASLVLLANCLMVQIVCADTYYGLDFEGAELASEGVQDNGKFYRLRTGGGGQDGKFSSGGRGSALLLETGPTPAGANYDRTELQIYSGITWERPWHVGFDLFLPRNAKISDDWQLLLQCPQHGVATSPPISLNLYPESTLTLVSRTESDTYEPLGSVALPRGRWVSVVMGFRMGANGYARLWIDGKKVVSVSSALGWKQGKQQCTLKTGIYRGRTDNGFSLKLDNIALGDHYKDVAR